MEDGVGISIWGYRVCKVGPLRNWRIFCHSYGHVRGTPWTCLHQMDLNDERGYSNSLLANIISCSLRIYSR